jgi:hypothetical protein
MLKITHMRTRLYLISAVVLLAGLGSAVLIYVTAEHGPDNAMGYEMAGGHVYPVAPEDSKTYMHDLELYGGKANVLANDFLRWFSGLWHGTSLAFTVACITILISSGFFFVAHHFPSATQSETRSENNRA